MSYIDPSASCICQSIQNENKRVRLTTILGGKAVDRVIGLGLGTNVAREGVGGEGAVVATVLVNTSDVDLDGSVVLGANEAVSGGAREGKPG